MELIALKKVVYNGKKYEPGETFKTNPKFGKAFIAIGKAKEVKGKVSIKEALAHVPVVEVLEEEPAVKEAPVVKKDTPKKTYKRRDMKAEQ